MPIADRWIASVGVDQGVERYPADPPFEVLLAVYVEIDKGPEYSARWLGQAHTSNLVVHWDTIDLHGPQPWQSHPQFDSQGRHHLRPLRPLRVTQSAIASIDTWVSDGPVHPLHGANPPGTVRPHKNCEHAGSSVHHPSA